jgi:hypothetical protein
MCPRRRLDHPGVKRQPPQQVQFRRVAQPFDGGLAEERGPRAGLLREVRNYLPGVTEYRMAAGVTVLNIEYRVLARLLDHLGKVEIEHRIVLAVEHHEADGILADLVDHLAQGDEIA